MISDAIFVYLSKKILQDKVDIEYFVNDRDNNVYLVNTYSNELFFIVRGG